MIVAAQCDFQIRWQIRTRFIFNGSADCAESCLCSGSRFTAVPLASFAQSAPTGVSASDVTAVPTTAAGSVVERGVEADATESVT